MKNGVYNEKKNNIEESNRKKMKSKKKIIEMK